MASRRPLALIVSLLISVVLSSVSGAQAMEASTGREAQRLDASRLFKEGKVLYDRGDFDGAIDRFRQAHDSWPDPLVIFAIAQAQRKKGDCAAALESYGRFMKLAEPSAVRNEAEDRVAELQRTCVVPDAPKSKAAPSVEHGPVIARVAIASVAPADPRPSSETTTAGSAPLLVFHPTDSAAVPRTSAHVVLAMTVGGVIVGGAGSGLFLWNTSRFDRWRNEDSSLSSGATGGTSAAQFTQRQQANDDLSRSIHRYDQISLGLVVAAGLTLATAAVVHLVSRE
jgi:hypothetical protein